MSWSRLHISVEMPDGVVHEYDVGTREGKLPRRDGEPPQYLEDYLEDYPGRVRIVEYGRKYFAASGDK